MCGIAGIFGNDANRTEIVSEMIETLVHRGNDSLGEYNDENIQLRHTRLAIVGIQDGQQPVYNTKENIISVTNGEIYNFRELSELLKHEGYEFLDKCDTNMIPYLYEEFGLKMFDMINGQFAMAIWDKDNAKLILARDKFGEKPLYYRKYNDSIYFSSEIKALLLIGENKINLEGLADICTTWVTVGTETIYQDIVSVGSGSYIEIDCENITTTKYFIPVFTNTKYESKTKSELVGELDSILLKSVKRHMDTEAPLAYYLSGGLDSSLIVSMASKIAGEKLHTFSISFEETSIDETNFQNVIASKLNTMHHRLRVTEEDIVNSFYDFVLHIQTPLLRLGTVPMYQLSKFVHDNGFKAVLSGEGADEMFGGYDIFKEAKIRAFCEREPEVNDRALLYKRTNSYISNFAHTNAAALATFFNQVNSNDLLSSHAIRFRFGKYCSQFFSSDVKQALKGYSVRNKIISGLPQNYAEYTDIAKAQYLEITTFMENYLLSSQGDRAAMAYSVECRYPFLDVEVVEFALRLNDRYKINVLNEKYLLKEVAKKYVPSEITNRKKFPYRAMITQEKLLRNEKIREAISEENIKKYNVFNYLAVSNYFNKISKKSILTEKELMLIIFICSTQIILSEQSIVY